MCDYSLHNVKTRPAQVGDKVTTRLFKSGTRGFCAPEDKSQRRRGFEETRFECVF